MIRRHKEYNVIITAGFSTCFRNKTLFNEVNWNLLKIKTLKSYNFTLKDMFLHSINCFCYQSLF
jgi:hypothetical protein